MSAMTRPTTQIGVLLALAILAMAALTATGIGAQTAGPNGADREPNFRSLRERGDVKFLPVPLQDRLLELARRPHSYLPLTVFGEAVEPSQLFGYYLLDTTGFQPNVFTSIVPGINDNGVTPTGANFANGGLPTVGAVRVTLEPSPACRRIPTIHGRSSTCSLTSRGCSSSTTSRAGTKDGCFTTCACRLSQRRTPTAARSSER